MSWRAWVAQGIGAIAIAVLLVLLPDDVYGGARDLLLLASAVVLVWVAVAVFLVPARNALAATFALPLRRSTGAFGMAADEDLRATFRPLVVPFVVLAVVGISAWIRSA